MTQFALTTTAWTLIASAGSTVEVECLAGAVKLALASSTPALNADGESLFLDAPYRKYDSALPNNLFATALYTGVNSVEVQPIGSASGGGATDIGQSGTAGDTAIAAGGQAQPLFGGATPANGFSVANPHASEDLWISDSTTAAPNAQGSTRVAAGYVYETPPAYKPAGPVSVYGATTGHPVTARRW